MSIVEGHIDKVKGHGHVKSGPLHPLGSNDFVLTKKKSNCCDERYFDYTKYHQIEFS